MRFPETGRIIYERNPIREVICQISFPRALIIEGTLPFEFQEAIKPLFPNVSIRDIVPLSITSFSPSENDAALDRRRQLYDFSTEDGKFTCTLSSEFLALTATSYECWENFLQHLQPTLEALADIYSPPYFTRLGLRYRNVFDRETLNLSATRWGDLVRPAALGIVSEEDVKIDDVIEAQSAVAIELETGKLFCRYGLLKEGDGPNKFLLDNDFFLDQNIRGVKDAVGTLAKLNNQSGSVFRWFIKDALHNAMEPKNAEKNEQSHMVIYNCAINAGSIFTQAMPKAWVLANYRPMGKSIGCVFKVDRVVQDFYWFEERQNTKSFVTDEPSVPKSDLSWYFEATAKSAGKAESSEIVAVINGFHQLVAKGEFSTIDSLITLCDVKKVRDEILVAFVESLYAFRKNIARYEKLFLKVGRELSARGYDRNEVLQGLSE